MKKNSMLKLGIIVFIIIGMIFYKFFIKVLYRKHLTYETYGKVELLQLPINKESHNNKVIKVLSKGVKGEILKTEITKSYKFYKIKTSDGISGYVLYDDSIRVTE